LNAQELTQSYSKLKDSQLCAKIQLSQTSTVITNKRTTKATLYLENPIQLPSGLQASFFSHTDASPCIKFSCKQKKLCVFCGVITKTPCLAFAWGLENLLMYFRQILWSRSERKHFVQWFYFQWLVVFKYHKSQA
jgi:hypothetical protein